MFVVCRHVVTLSAREIVVFVETILASEFVWSPSARTKSDYTLHNGEAVGPAPKKVMTPLH